MLTIKRDIDGKEVKKSERFKFKISSGRGMFGDSINNSVISLENPNTLLPVDNF